MSRFLDMTPRPRHEKARSANSVSLIPSSRALVRNGVLFLWKNAALAPFFAESAALVCGQTS